MCFHVVPIWSPCSHCAAPPRAQQRLGAAEQGRARSSPNAGLGTWQLPSSQTSRYIPQPVLSWGTQGTSTPLRGETGSWQIPPGDAMPGEVTTGPCPVEGQTSLLWHLAWPWALSSLWGLVFHLLSDLQGWHWAGSQEHPASLFSIHFTLPSFWLGLWLPPPHPQV